MTDPIGDMLSRIRNAQCSRHESVKIPFSQIKLEIVKILHNEGLVGAYRLAATPRGGKEVEVALRYRDKKIPIISELKRSSRPGRRIYVGYDEIPSVCSGVGIVILSTSKGIMTERQAREMKVGGEIICTVL
ncbi:MAG: 30S ribosomal protein S8 [Deltaproteobacteria bacterium]|nr:30S ribosomal protein S8 [Deltaproteobacteria bacterium]